MHNQQWREIETAPKDELILVARTKRMCGPCAAMNDSRDGWVTETPAEWISIYTPSHWMPLPPGPDAKCWTCSGHGAVGNILTAEPCPDCTPGAAPAAPGVVEALDRMDALLDPANGLLTVSGTSATVVASRADMALIRAALAVKESP